LNDHTKAEDYINKAIKIRKNYLGINHNKTIFSNFILASILCDQNKIDDALELAKK